MFSLQEQVDVNNPLHTNLLANLQANILKHHGRSFAWHIFIQFDAQKTAAIKTWIKQFTNVLTSAGKQLEDAALHKLNASYDGGMVCCLFLTSQGYNKLGVPVTPTETAFTAGLKNRQQSEKLFAASYNDWDDRFKDTDAMILLADMDEDNLQQAYNDLVTQANGLFTKLGLQKGAILNKQGIGIEHFGYADGVSQPSFIKGAIKPGKTWDDNCLPQILLVPENVTGNQDCFGSYFVFLKLEQNVEGFNTAEDALGDTLKALPGQKSGFNEEVAGAYLVGRFEASNPVVKYDKENEITSDDQFDNDFDYRYDKAGSKCPFHAHIRLTNPRNGGTTHTAARITRRGIPYDEAGRNNDLTFEPSQDVGLLFMSYQASIANQFEVIQQAANTGLGKFGIDAVIGQGTNPNTQQVPAVWGNNAAMQSTNISGFVIMKGGEYFYAPSIPFLKNL